MSVLHLAVIVTLLGAVACSNSEFGGLAGSKDKSKDKDDGEELGTSGEDTKDTGGTVDEPEQVAGAFLVECSAVDSATWTGDASALEYSTVYGCGIFNSAEDKTEVSGLVITKAALADAIDVPFKSTEDPEVQVLVSVPNAKIPGGELHLTYTLAAATDEVVVSLGDEKPRGCSLLAEESPKVLPVIMDLETFTKRGLEEGGKEPLQLFKDVAFGETNHAIKLTHVEGEVLYDLHATSGAVLKHAACPFRHKIAFKDAAGAVLPGKTLDELQAAGAVGMDIPSGAVSASIGFEEPSTDDYDDNEGVVRYADKALEFSTGGCQFKFQLVECIP